MKLNNIRLLVKDFDTCFAFYHDILGLKSTWGKPGDNFASFDVGLPSGLALFKAALMDMAINKPKSEKHPDKAAIILQVERVDEIYADLQKRGVKFLTAPTDMPAWGIRVAHFRDPEHNLIELYEELPKDKWATHLVEDEKVFSEKSH